MNSEPDKPGSCFSQLPAPERAFLSDLKPVLELRSRLLQAARRFFHERGYLEVETPVRIPAPALELHIDAEPSGKGWLRTSPELHMKRLLAAGYGKIFQIGPCFRHGERGRLHHPEFTLLEWYRAGASALDILGETKSFVAFTAEQVLGRTWLETGGARVELMPRWEHFAVAELFNAYAGWDPVKTFDAGRFDADLVEKVEPRLPKDLPVVLMDYPAAVAALARRKPDCPEVAERWELYIGGLELANAFGELTEPAEQRRRFEQCRDERKALGREAYPMDEPFLRALEAGLPPCAGIAFGLDRWLLLLAGKTSLDEILPFRETVG